MSLLNFSAFALTKAEMKNVVGGSILCGCSYGGVDVYGYCSGPSVSACNNYKCSGGGKNTGCS